MSAAPRTKGFTLIEIIVVLAMVAVLAAVTAPSIVKHIGDSKIERAKKDVEMIASSLTSFYKDLGRWPTDNDNNKALTDQEVSLLRTTDGDMATEVAGAGWNALNAVATRDDFDNQLILNTPGLVAARAYATTGERRWNGPYTNAFKADPWGMKYLCNIGGFQIGQTGSVWVLTAGPNQVLDTPTTATAPQGDDIGYLLRR